MNCELICLLSGGWYPPLLVPCALWINLTTPPSASHPPPLTRAGVKRWQHSVLLFIIRVRVPRPQFLISHFSFCGQRPQLPRHSSFFCREGTETLPWYPPLQIERSGTSASVSPTISHSVAASLGDLSPTSLFISEATSFCGHRPQLPRPPFFFLLFSFFFASNASLLVPCALCLILSHTAHRAVLYSPIVYTSGLPCHYPARLPSGSEMPENAFR